MGPGVGEFAYSTAPGLRQSFGWRRERAWDRTTRPLFVPTVSVPLRSPVMKPRDCFLILSGEHSAVRPATIAAIKGEPKVCNNSRNVVVRSKSPLA